MPPPSVRTPAPPPSTFHTPRNIPPTRCETKSGRPSPTATRQSLLRPNAVHPVTDKNTGDNLGGKFFPTIHFTESQDDTLTIDLILKGGGCENVGAQYKLPDTTLQAGRDLDGVRRVVQDAVWQAQGRGCAPGVLGVAIGGDRASGYQAAKQTLLRPLR